MQCTKGRGGERRGDQATAVTVQSMCACVRWGSWVLCEWERINGYRGFTLLVVFPVEERPQWGSEASEEGLPGTKWGMTVMGTWLTGNGQILDLEIQEIRRACRTV